MRRWFQLSLLLMAALALTSPAAMAQCAMCYESASHAGPQAAKTLNYAILALLSPALLMFAGIVIFSVRKKTAAEEPVEI
ncbi:MAG: hypothetical protein HY046_11610 [Acidobacteria bacterium]|nr:hypothetical protein [Acidobacteriota bacterium]